MGSVGSMPKLVESVIASFTDAELQEVLQNVCETERQRLISSLVEREMATDVADDCPRGAKRHCLKPTPPSTKPPDHLVAVGDEKKGSSKAWSKAAAVVVKENRRCPIPRSTGIVGEHIIRLA